MPWIPLEQPPSARRPRASSGQQLPRFVHLAWPRQPQRRQANPRRAEYWEAENLLVRARHPTVRAEN